MFFIIVIAVSALFLAGCSAFFSVSGISSLFAGAFWPVVYMASSLELGKLVAVSFLHRFWPKIHLWLKTLLSLFVVILMLITSMGVFGYLTAAYQGSATQVEGFERKTSSLEQTKRYAQEELMANNKRIDSLSNTRTKQAEKLTETSTRTFIQTTAAMTASIDKDIAELKKGNEVQLAKIKEVDDQLQALNAEMNTHSDIGSFKFIAKALSMSVNDVAKWFILILVLVFDPLAVALVIAVNFAIEQRIVVLNTPKQEQIEPTMDQIPAETLKIEVKPKEQVIPVKGETLIIPREVEAPDKDISLYDKPEISALNIAADETRAQVNTTRIVMGNQKK